MLAHTCEKGAMRSVSAALRTLGGQGGAEPSTDAPGRPFITITRQAGAGGRTLGERLVASSNAAGAKPPWQVYDRELIERVASDHDLPRWVVEAVAQRPHSWLEDMASGLVFEGPRPPDEAVYRKVVGTIRALARAGHAVLIGRGAAFCTQDLPGGIHVQLIAPFEDRVRRAAEERGITLEQADHWVRQTDANREAFYKRFWSNRARALDRFTLTINTARVEVEAQIVMIQALVAIRA